MKVGKKYRPAGSLAWRVVTICILLLVIPLVFQSLFLYHQEYKEKLSDVKANLSLLARERGYLIEELVQMNNSLLDEIGNLQFSGESGPKFSFIKKIPIPFGVGDRFVIPGKNQTLLVGKKESERYALTIPIPYSRFFEHLHSSYPIQISLIDGKGKVIGENRQLKDQEDLLVVTDPIEGTDLKVQLTIPKDLITELHQRSYYYRFATLMIFVGLFGGGAVYFFTRRIEKPLKGLCQTMEKVSLGAIHARYTSDRMGFEIDALGRQFNQMLDSLLASIEETQKEKIKREKLAEELKIGHEIQSSLFPSHLPGFKGVDIAVGHLPAKEVNGDYYDLFPLSSGKLLLVICDTAGKGVSACLYSLGLRSMIRSLASVTDDLSEIVIKANDLFWLDTHQTGMFATIWLGLYDPAKNLLSYCSQGHPPALLRRGGRINRLWSEGIALGAQKFDVVSKKEISLQNGDLVFLYTDGIIEAHDVEQRLFGKERLDQFLLKNEKNSPTQLSGALLEEVHLFSRGAPQHDDMTFVMIQFSH